LNLKHPHLVRGLAAGRDAQSKRRYLVLEYIDGPNAALLLERQGRLDVNDVVHIGIGIARALAYLHQQGCVHRDVKPDNIMLSPCGSAKLIDLGLAYLSDPNENLLTLTNNPLGTSYYMPWEQGRTERHFRLGGNNVSFVDGAGAVPRRQSRRGHAQEASRPIRPGGSAESGCPGEVGVDSTAHDGARSASTLGLR
jgi:serine/threonine-protein kinase